MKRRCGFTLVELVVVIAVIAILATVTLVLFAGTQMKSRDAARENNVKTLGTLLDKYYDKNGFYPTGCGDPTCTNGTVLYVPSPDTIGITTTVSQLSTMLGQNTSNLVDPSDKDTSPFIGQYYTIDNSIPGYVYRGAFTLNPAWSGSVTQGAVKLIETGSSRQCAVWYKLDSSSQKPYDTTSYFIAYYAESTKTWQIYLGKHGVQPYIDSGATAGFCNIVT